MTFPMVALRRVVRIVNGGTPTPDESNWNGGVPWATPVDLGARNGQTISETSRTLTAEGVQTGSATAPVSAVLLSTRAPIGYVARVEVPMAFNQGCKALVPGPDLSSPFLLYVMLHSTKKLQSLGQGSTFQELSGNSLSALEISLPSVQLQRQIADYLDAQTAKIDSLIAKQELLIVTLAERRQAVISHAVTKGIDPNAPMKDSHVEWLGDVPRAWAVTQLKYGYDVVLGKMLDAGRGEKFGDELLPYIRAANIQESGLDLGDVNSMPFTPSEQSRFSLKRHDLLVVEGGAVGVCVVLESDMPAWGFQKTVNRVRARRRNSTTFLSYFLDAIRASGVVDMMCNKSTISHFTAEKLEAVTIAMPPVGEQESISRYLDHETSKIDALSAKAREMIDVLKERRQALISAAVTGKIDVRGLV